ncbi:MAG TPA: MoaD/ThiS family protein [Ferruginibacter sp.]|nr:MoaD/ThiS family protein [Ferruginibacter sp.]
MKINILSFGQVAEALKANQLLLTDMDNTDRVLSYLLTAYPQLQTMEFTLAVNKQLIHGNTALKDDDTLALLPPFSGG